MVRTLGDVLDPVVLSNGFIDSSVNPIHIQEPDLQNRFLLQKHFFVKCLLGTAVLALLAVIVPLRSASAQSVYGGPYFPYDAFSELPKTRIALRQGVLEVAFAPGSLRIPRKEIIAWTRISAEAVVAYYGRLPTPIARLLYVPVSGGRVNGTTYGFRGPATRILLGRNLTRADLETDWVLVHELVHHGFPSIVGRRNWTHEGLATYVEPIARAQMGLIPVEEVWRQLVVGLPHGQPRSGDSGLDGTPTWGRTYWGGAMFFLIADVEIRRRTNNRKGLQDALQLSVASGGNISEEWTFDRFSAMAARATGTVVLEQLYDCLKDTPRTIDLTGLWRDLGISMAGRQVRFNDDALLANVRKTITRPHPVSSELFNSAAVKRRNVITSPCSTFPWIHRR